EMIRSGELGAIRLVQVEHASGWAATLLEASGHKQASWRTTPSIARKSAVVGDIGTHAHHLARFVTGLEVTEVSAELSTMVPGRKADDNAHVKLRFTNGARGLMWVSMAATGNLHGQRIRVFGEKASLEWIQEQPEQLHLRPLDGPHRVLWRGCGYLSAAAQRATRLWPGHPEGFLEAFANLYAGTADAVLARKDDAPLDRAALSFHTVEDGVLGVKFVDAVVEVVNVAAPNGMHLEINRAALQAGKHVLCEKPVGREPKETLESHAAARKAGTITFVGYNYRWAPLVQYARKLVGEGKLGKL